MTLTGHCSKSDAGSGGSYWWKTIIGLLTAVILFGAAPAHGFLARPAIFSTIGSITKAPNGWLQFCKEQPDECRPAAEPQGDVTLTPELLQQLFSVNAYANNRVKWTPDVEQFGKAERWAYPLDRGDCEDIVLLKRQLLAKAGWPIGALLVTTVEERGRNGGRHAVLTVRTDRGEMILDNETPEVLFWYETGYRYLSRQTSTDPNVWVSITEQPGPGAPSVAR